jgi:hypothetical protein
MVSSCSGGTDRKKFIREFAGRGKRVAPGKVAYEIGCIILIPADKHFFD